MKKFAIVVFLITLLASTVYAEPVVLKYATFEPPQAFAIRAIWQPWIDEMNKAIEESESD